MVDLKFLESFLYEMRPNKNITVEDEVKLTYKLGERLLADGYTAHNTTVVTVSSDYSSCVGMWLRHYLSYNGEICDGFDVDVPYPDQIWDSRYKAELEANFSLYKDYCTNKSLLLVESGVIRGGNYTYLADWVKQSIECSSVITLTLYENIGSKYKSNYVGEYYNDEVEDLTFWWERYNNHWSIKK